MGLYRSLAGLVRVSVTSADIPGLLAVLAKGDIPVLDGAGDGELDMEFTIYRRDFRRLRKICEGRGDSLKVSGRWGLYWLIKGLGKRPVLVVGMVILLWLMLWIPTHVFFVQVEGNATIPDRLILAAAEESGIRFGASRREVRSERMKNALLEAVPELQWAGVNTYGCVAVITVREKSVTEEERVEYAVSSIVAGCDGVILSATATSGSLLCQPGQAVMAGEVLISGYTDCGLTIQATRAEGEVYARTIHHVTVISPVEYQKRGDVTRKSVSYSLIVGKNRINLWKDSGISGVTCGRMYKEYYMTLPGGFQLPVALVRETVTEYETEAVEVLAEDAMEKFSGEYLLTQIIAGSIESRVDRFLLDGDVYRLESTFLCTEMIGRQKAEEIGDQHG